MKMRETSRDIDKKLYVNNNKNKGVVSTILDDIQIVDDDQLPIIENGPFKGLRAEICCNPLGIIGRLNPSQLYEQEFNFISMYIRLKIKESNTLEEKEKWYFDFINTINVRQYNFTKNFYDLLGEDEKWEFMKECEDHIYIHQEPFFNDTDFNLLCSLYDKYDFVEPFKFEGINIPLVMGEMYFIKLKHDAKSKMSARSTGFENLKNAPSKDKAYKYKKAPISKTPIRIGNMELLNTLVTSDDKGVSNLLETYSSNEDAKERLLMALLTGDPYNINVDLSNIEKNETKKLVDTLLFNLSLKLEDVDDDE